MKLITLTPKYKNKDYFINSLNFRKAQGSFTPFSR